MENHSERQADFVGAQFIDSFTRELINKDDNFGFISRVSVLREHIADISDDQLNQLKDTLSSREVFNKCHQETNSYDYHGWWTTMTVIETVLNDRANRSVPVTS